MLYFVPAGLYTIYNNLGYYSLTYFDPTTYFVLMQFRTVITGIVWQVVLVRCL